MPFFPTSVQSKDYARSLTVARNLRASIQVNVPNCAERQEAGQGNIQQRKREKMRKCLVHQSSSRMMSEAPNQHRYGKASGIFQLFLLHMYVFQVMAELRYY
jgi:hypothetical protein